MSISPEIGKIPFFGLTFARAGLADQLFLDIVRGRTRDFNADAILLSREFDKKLLVQISGIGNISADNGSLVVFNHPNTDILLPAFLKLMIEINADKRKNPVFVMGSEIPLFGRFNKYALPGSQILLRRFIGMYPDNIIPVPTAQGRKDYTRGRVSATRCVIKALKKGNIVMISPEGHVEIGNQISPVETFHAGSGELAIIALRHKIPINPVGIWGKRNIINVVVGKPFYPGTDNRVEAVNDLMGHIAGLLPEELRGPFNLRYT